MRKLVLTFLIVMNLFVTSVGQNTKSSLTLSFGPVIPVGKFGSKDFEDAGSGKAAIGQAISILYSSPGKNGWSAVAAITAQRNPVNDNAYQSEYSKPVTVYSVDPETAEQQERSYTFTNWKFNNKPWLQASLQVGVQKLFTVSNKIDLHARVMGGGILVKLVRINAESSAQELAVAYYKNSEKTLGICYSLGGGLNYNLTKKVFLTASANYAATNKLKFKNVKSGGAFAIYGDPSQLGSLPQSSIFSMIKNEEYVISSIGFNIGMGLKL